MQPSGRETQHAVPRVVHVLVPRLLTVARVTELSRAMRRVTLTGSALAGFAALAATDHAKVFFPADDAEPGMPVLTDGHWTSRALLAEAVAGTALGTGPGYVWAAAEAAQVRAIRADVRARGIGGGSASATGYWRLGVANFDHKSPEA